MIKEKPSIKGAEIKVLRLKEAIISIVVLDPCHLKAANELLDDLNKIRKHIAELEKAQKEKADEDSEISGLEDIYSSLERCELRLISQR